MTPSDIVLILQIVAIVLQAAFTIVNLIIASKVVTITKVLTPPDKP